MDDQCIIINRTSVIQYTSNQYDSTKTHLTTRTMRFSLEIISAFVVLAIVIDGSPVNAKNVPTTDGENHLKTTLNHTDQTTGKFNLIKHSFM